jgi:hypothetical protein
MAEGMNCVGFKCPLPVSIVDHGPHRVATIQF